jgi:diguanylate cyclase (GGDEF)-like protein/PAS domain S-box-containing protein
MFSKGSHRDLRDSLETIGASFAIFEVLKDLTSIEIISANTLFEEIALKSIPDCVGKLSSEVFPRYLEQPMKTLVTKCIKTQTPVEDEIIVDHYGVSRYWRVVISPIIEKDLKATRVIFTGVEITDKKLLESQLETTRQRYEAVVEAAYDGIITIDENQNILQINQAAKDIFKLQTENIIGKPLTTLMPQKYRSKHPTYVSGFKNSKVDSRPMQARVSFRGLRRDGTEFPIEVTISKIKVSDQVEMTAVIRDISERAKLVEELSKAATEDSLTHIPNRRHFEQSLRKENERAKRFERNYALIMMDIDHFKHFNDEYGHGFGDEVLVQLGLAIKKNNREIDSCARWGGEEFMVMLPETDLDGAKNWAQKFQKYLNSKTIEHHSDKAKISVSIGLVQISDFGFNIQDALEAVDKHLYEAKKAGRNTIKF